ncbi:riboflavin kinase [Patescibacteria group bacterium]|nr:riboflavin kinase [Patescibacteria group bacterium]
MKLIKGLVVPGFKEGRKLGYPTANLKLFVKTVRPKPGIYACRVKRSTGLKYEAILVSGVYKEATGQPRLEVYLLDWQGNLYGEKLTIELFDKMRDLVVITNKANLKKIIQADIKAAKLFFKSLASISK